MTLKSNQDKGGLFNDEGFILEFMEIDRWVGEEGRTLLSLSVNPDIFRMVIGRLYMRIAHRTATFLCKVKNHKGGTII